MSWRTPIKAAEPHDVCPHCGTIKRQTSIVCHPCFKEVPWELWRDLMTATGIEHLHATHNTLSPFRSLEACAAAVKAATQAILHHLKLHSSAV